MKIIEWPGAEIGDKLLDHRIHRGALRGIDIGDASHRLPFVLRSRRRERCERHEDDHERGSHQTSSFCTAARRWYGIDSMRNEPTQIAAAAIGWPSVK